MSALSGEFGAYLALVLVGFLPNEIWRWLAVIFSRGLDEDAEILIWVRAVATAILAGVIAKLTIFSPGVLATIPTPLRLGAVADRRARFPADPALGVRRRDRGGGGAGAGGAVVRSLTVERPQVASPFRTR